MKGSPFKLKSPLYNHEPGHVDALGTINPTSIGMAKNTVGQNKSVITSPSTGEVLSGVDGDTSIETTSPQDNVNNLLTKIDDADKAYGTAFENDGRSSGQFEKRINKATDEGKLGRVQRLKNRKAGFMESQANKLEKAGGTLTNDQKIALNKAGDEAKGTNAGRGFRAFLNRDSKVRKVDPVPVKKENEDKNEGELTTGNSSGKSISIKMNKPDFSSVEKKNGISDEERASRRQASGNYNEDGTPKPKKERD